MLNRLKEYINKMYHTATTSDSYGTDLERYIIAHNPVTVYDVEFLTKKYDKQTNRNWPL